MNFFYKCALLFFFVYDIGFTFLPFFTTARIVIIILLLSHFRSKNKFPGYIKNYIIFLLLLTLVSAFQTLYSADSTQLSRLVFYIGYTILGSFLFVRLFNNFKDLLKAFCIVTAIQSIAVLYMFFNPSFKEIVSHYIQFGGNFTYEYLYRSFGLTSASGAALSLIQSIGVISFVILYRYRSKLSLNYYPYAILALFSLFSTMVTGRTGLLISILSVFFLLFTLNFKLKQFLTIVLSLIFFLQFNIFDVLIQYTDRIDGFSSEYYSKWLSEGLEVNTNNKTLESLSKQNIPRLTIETFIGTGRVVSENGIGNASGNDRGYIQTYYSLGLFSTILFYLGLIYFISRNFYQFDKKITVFVVIILLLIDYKEPFIFKYMFPFFLFSVLISLRYYGISTVVTVKNKLTAP